MKNSFALIAVVLAIAVGCSIVLPELRPVALSFAATIVAAIVYSFVGLPRGVERTFLRAVVPVALGLAVMVCTAGFAVLLFVTGVELSAAGWPSAAVSTVVIAILAGLLGAEGMTRVIF